MNMINTNEPRWLIRTVPDHRTDETQTVLQTKWVAQQLPAGATELPFEWRDVPTVVQPKPQAPEPKETEGT